MKYSLPQKIEYNYGNSHQLFVQLQVSSSTTHLQKQLSNPIPSSSFLEPEKSQYFPIPLTRF